MVIVLLGVSGSGKTTLGKMLAAKLGWPFYEADDFHPAANIAKMSQGLPLTDADRAPWLIALAERIHVCLQAETNAVFTCSGLKQAYRDRLRLKNEGLQFVFLKGDYALVERRLSARRDHFMPPGLLGSQFAALETPTDALMIDVAQPPEDCVQSIKRGLGL